ncbi:MAG: type II toxin-antitoxin system HicB family antitoxin [Oscillospiraceae bacterium]|jgi:predicted RNase H-like HicB family nuclease|nr:type II toxin-antitoxin system HicB family antitoxin [Oscillospiraceae bacterium]
MAKHFYPAVFSPETDGYTVSFPDLPGCFTEGDSLEEAYEMAFAALGLYLQGENGVFLYPVASLPSALVCEGGAFVALVEFDEAEYQRKHGIELVKKTLTIPSWVNATAEKLGVNFSATLTEALVEVIQAKTA